MRKIKPCKVCKKEFEACSTTIGGAFSWRATFCSPACFQLDIERNLESRSAAKAEKSAPKKRAPRKPKPAAVETSVLSEADA